MAVAIRKVCASLGTTIVNNSFLVPKQTTVPQVAGLITKAIRDLDKNYKRPHAFPYKEKKYRTIDSCFDSTTWRFDENSKIIVVDGPVESGKEQVAKSIAEAFDLHYIPHVNLDSYYINPYGVDMRQYNMELPFRYRSFDIEEFLANPFDKRTVIMQIIISRLRLEQYLDALNHVLNTGQGVVMNRSIYSDIVFLETYEKFGFYPKTFKKLYNTNWDEISSDLLQPHLIVYLDAPVDMIRDKLKKKNNPVEINSPVYQPEVLREFENVYKNQHLKTMGKHAEVLSYNMEDFDLDILIEDMEDVNLSDYKKHDPKMNDWRLACEAFWNFKRIFYSADRYILETWQFHIPAGYECEEAFMTGEEEQRFMEVYEEIPGNKYEVGYNKDMGDANVWLRSKP